MKKQKPKALELRPYYVEERDPSPEWARRTRELVGFDIERTADGLRAWLRREGHVRPEHHRGAWEPAFDAFADEPEPVTKAQRKARAAANALMSLMNLERMYGPERVAARRWYRALQALQALQDQIAEILPLARVRLQEDGYFLSRCSGHARIAYGKRFRQTKGCLSAAGALARRARDAQRFMPHYTGDSLSHANAEGRMSKGYLANIELSLSGAGFTYAEIASVVVDDEAPARRASPIQLRAAADRVRKRIAGARTRRRKAED